MMRSLMSKNFLLKLWPWAMWSIGTAFVMFQFLLQLSSGVMAESLMKAFSTSAVGAGLLSSAYYYIYVSLQTPAGMLIDRFGARRLMSFGAVVCALGCLVFSQTDHLWIAALARAMMGGLCQNSVPGPSGRNVHVLRASLTPDQRDRKVRSLGNDANYVGGIHGAFENNSM